MLLGVVRKDMAEHAWLKGMSPEERAKIDAFYKERYGAEPAKTPKP